MQSIRGWDRVSVLAPTGVLALLLISAAPTGCGSSSHGSGDGDGDIDGDSDADSDTDSDGDTDSDSDSDSDADADGDGDADGDADADGDGDGDADADADGDGDGGELDLGPDARPSDYPDAADWIDTDPAAISDDDPCCSLVGEPVPLEGVDSGLPQVAWNGAGWGVAWGGLDFRSVGPLGELEAETAHVESCCYATGLVWGHDRYALVATDREEAELRILDRHGALLAGPTEIEGSLLYLHIARQVHGHGWVMTGLNPEADVFATWVDDQGNIDPESQVVGPYGRSSVVGLKSRVSIAWSNRDGVWHRSVRWPEVDLAPEPRRVLPLSMPHARAGLVAHRDTAVVAGMDGNVVQVAVIDPWADEVISGPHDVGESTIVDREPSLASAQERGFLGLCYAADGGIPVDARVVFRLLGPDGVPWGQPIQIVGGQAIQCAVGWSGEEFLVVGWGADGRMRFQRVAPNL